MRTAFNILGPVLNPARAAYALVGVYDPAISGLMADVLLRTGVSKALVVHSCGLDELTPMGAADIVEVRVGANTHAESCVEATHRARQSSVMLSWRWDSHCGRAGVRGRVLRYGSERHAFPATSATITQPQPSIFACSCCDAYTVVLHALPVTARWTGTGTGTKTRLPAASSTCSVQVTPQGTRHYTLDPLDLGIPRCQVEDLKGGDAALNAQILRVCADRQYRVVVFETSRVRLHSDRCPVLRGFGLPRSHREHNISEAALLMLEYLT